MEFGLNFFPDVGPEDMSGAKYWNDALDLTGLCDELGFTHTMPVEGAEASMRLFAEQVMPHFA